MNHEIVCFKDSAVVSNHVAICCVSYKLSTRCAKGLKKEEKDKNVKR